MELLIFLLLLGGIVGLALFKRSKKDSTTSDEMSDDLFVHPKTRKTTKKKTIKSKSKSVKSKQ